MQIAESLPFYIIRYPLDEAAIIHDIIFPCVFNVKQYIYLVVKSNANVTMRFLSIDTDNIFA